MQLPPLQTLRAFEAAARLGSFARAAEELSLTASAVSHHMKGLEARLKVPLFQRRGRGVALSEAGQALHIKLAQGLALIEQAFADAHRRKRWRALTVSVLPAFASRWLIPRLHDFQAAHRGIDVNLRATQELVDLARDGVDLAIRYGPGGWRDVAQLKLREELLFPVCSPRFNGGRLPAAPKELAKLPLLRHDRQPWTPWFRAAGLKLTEPSRGLSFNEAGGLLQAAAEGHGIALARATLVEDDFRSGRLVRLFDVAVVDRYAWYAVWRERSDKTADVAADVAAFCHWLQAALAAGR
jgi:LysR family transcriptional regulator, glycine cleavage system transcriptional activator